LIGRLHVKGAEDRLWKIAANFGIVGAMERSMITMDEDEKEWFEELNREAVKRHLDSKKWSIPESEFDTRYSRGALDGWLDAYFDGQSPSQALDSAGLVARAVKNGT
jgi:hypothetical protein